MQMVSTQEPQHTHQQLLNTILAEQQDKEGNLLPILHAIQDRFGYIPEDLLAPLAEALNQTAAEIYGVISFYTHFRMQPCGDIHIEFCQAEACQARGATRLAQELKHCLAEHYPEATLEPVYCLGLCAQGPAATINQKLMARLTLDKLKTTLEALQGAASCKN